MLKIIKVRFGSPAWKAGIKKGDEILAFDGHPYKDALDFAYYDGQTAFDVTVTRGSKQKTMHVDKEESTPMGIEYEQEDLPLTHCQNKCIFCFVDQCPKGMRKTLYVKDDDYRSSFACGNYVTLSNITDEDLERILRLKLSPLYISVHAYDPEVKKLLCANPKSAKVFEYMRAFAQAGITMHAQIVMIEGINSDDVLKETLDELYKLFPFVQTVAIVPVGLTGHREGLYPLKPVSQACALRTIEMVEKMQAEIVKTHPEGWVWCSDEMYVIADREVPSYESYGDFGQIENGVGLISTFDHGVELALQEEPAVRGQYTLVTGKSFEKHLKGVCDALSAKYPVDLDLVAVENDWFGHTITVAGLLTGTDIVKTLKARGYYKDVLLPSNTLKEFETVLLDGMSVQDMERELDCKIHICQGGEHLIHILSGNEENYE